MRLTAALLLCLALPAHGAGYVPLRERLAPAELAAIGLTDAQVERLDAALRVADARARAPASSAVASAVSAGATPKATDRAPSAAPADARPRLGLGDQPIAARAAGRVAAWSPGTVFTLDNGQRWQVLKGAATLRAALDSPRVRVVPGLGGRWFLEVSEDLPKARVFLLD
jgi:hypothetical protein